MRRAGHTQRPRNPSADGGRRQGGKERATSRLRVGCGGSGGLLRLMGGHGGLDVPGGRDCKRRVAGYCAVYSTRPW
jgi:hypothetical protein